MFYIHENDLISSEHNGIQVYFSMNHPDVFVDIVESVLNKSHYPYDYIGICYSLQKDEDLKLIGRASDGDIFFVDHINQIQVVMKYPDIVHYARVASRNFLIEYEDYGEQLNRIWNDYGSNDEV